MTLYPTRPQRKSILENILKDIPLKEPLNGKNPIEYYSVQISMRTSGYVARDLRLLCRTALLKSMRPSKHLTTLEDLSNELSYLSLHSDGKSQGAVGWPEFEYSFEIYQPSQRAEVQSSLPKRDWSEIGGYKSLKQKMKQATLLPLLQPEVFTRLGVQPTSGLLLYGPSGCGKTAMVHALVAESMMNVISIKGPEIFSKYFGETESKIRQLFATAKQIAPCVMFIDEMDAIGSKRGEQLLCDSGGGVNERVLSTLLNEMDGVEGRQGVIVIGCTNRPHDIDDAVLRPGRLDQLVYIGLPTKEDRMEIIQILTKKMAVSPEIDIESLAQQTEYCTGADLDNMFREAGILALRQNINASVIEEKHLQRVIESTCERARHQVLNENSLLVFEKFQNDHDF
ncbi:P-loop containing nucleoside triphosphate hydrolase protein [Spinellus fusiger]|nr:P-loop containing nucleoside triphosphate hydrolase protein [Spinellus fusiger]